MVLYLYKLRVRCGCKLRETLTFKSNELIRSRRRKIAIRRAVILTLLLVSLLIILCLKLSYFNISNIQVYNNKIVSSEEIVKLSKINKGTNIFYLNLKSIETNVLENPYLLNVKIKRKIPNTISIDIQEREAVFYIKTENGYLIVDKSGIILENRNDISNMKLTNLQGFKLEGAAVGNVLPCDDKRKLDVISLITELISLNTSGLDITSVDLSDILNIKVYIGSLCIKMGTDENIKDKLNLSLNIINNNNLKDSKGYIDVGFEGNPVLFIDK